MGGFSTAAARDTSVADGFACSRGTNFTVLLLQLHVHPAFRDRVSTHPDLLPDGAKDGPIQEDGHLLSDLHTRDLAARECFSALWRQSRHDIPEIKAKQEAAALLATQGKNMEPENVESCAN
jgi:hypothetical protein